MNKAAYAYITLGIGAVLAGCGGNSGSGSVTQVPFPVGGRTASSAPNAFPSGLLTAPTPVATPTQSPGAGPAPSSTPLRPSPSPSASAFAAAPQARRLGVLFDGDLLAPMRRLPRVVRRA